MSHTAHGSAPLADLLRQHSINLKLRLSELWFYLKIPTRANSSDAAIIARDNCRCVYCRCDLTDEGDTRATIDHVIPKCRFKSWAAANQDANRVACCLRCNQAKRDWAPPTPSHRAWYDRDYCLKFIAAHIRDRSKAEPNI
jgi:hypothetical protein